MYNIDSNPKISIMKKNVLIVVMLSSFFVGNAQGTMFASVAPTGHALY